LALRILTKVLALDDKVLALREKSFVGLANVVAVRVYSAHTHGVT